MKTTQTGRILGTSHTPEIERGVYAVGSSMKHDVAYNQGPTEWIHTNVWHKTLSNEEIQVLFNDVDFAQTELRLLALDEANQPRRREAIEHTRRKRNK